MAGRVVSGMGNLTLSEYDDCPDPVAIVRRNDTAK